MNKKDRHSLYRYSVGPGWWGILDKYVPPLVNKDPNCNLYIKEKYGVLRMYITSKLLNMDERERIEEAAECESEIVCEVCGAPGTLRSERAWMETLCDRCDVADRKLRDCIEAEAEQQWLNLALEEL